jgi:hypothetical protein
MAMTSKCSDDPQNTFLSASVLFYLFRLFYGYPKHWLLVFLFVFRLEFSAASLITPVTYQHSFPGHSFFSPQTLPP